MYNHLISFIKKSIKSVTGLLQSHVWIIEGEDYLDDDFRIYFIGSTIQKNYIASLFFSGSSKEKSLGKKNILQIKSLIKCNEVNASFLIVEGLKNDVKNLETKRDFFLPLWLDAEVDIPLLAKSQGAKSDLKKLRHNKLEFMLSKDIDDVDLFYHKMYQPYLEARYKDQAIPMKYEVFKQGFLNGSVEILFILKDNHKIAGQVIDYSNAQPRLWAVGIFNNDKRYLSMSVISACYYFSSIHLSEQGFTSMNIGKSRPVITDGALQFKIKWGMKIFNSMEKGLLIKQLKTKNRSIKFFLDHPFVFKDDEQLFSAVFIERNDEKTNLRLKEIIKRNLYLLPGVNKLSIYQSFDRSNEVIKFNNKN